MPNRTEQDLIREIYNHPVKDNKTISRNKNICYQ